MQHPFETRLAIVQRVKAGTPIHRLWRELGIKERTILEWVRRYDRAGEAGLRPRAAARPTSAQRVAMARRHIEKGVPLLEISRARGVSRAALEKWVRVARARGYAALRGPRGGKGKEASPMGQPRKRAPQTPLERLAQENARLQAELALLKKLRTLARARAPRRGASGRKPSKR